MAATLARTYSVGAEPLSDGVHFRVWAPQCGTVRVTLEDERESRELTSEESGYFSGHWSGLKPGAKYFYLLDDDPKSYPDPASRFQPDGVHGPSQVVDPKSYVWKNSNQWRGVKLPGQVIYELHIGCFTPEGTWRAAEEKLPHLVETGITTVEVMPVADFDGEFGWGYDGVYWYAPTRLYGTPDDFRHFIDTAHGLGLAVILDVVYNHFGPSGNYTAAYSPHFVSKRHPTEWGDAVNYDDEGAAGVREFVRENGAYWIRDFQLDGLRLDATQTIYDDSERHVLAELNVAAREAAGDRSVIIVAENETQVVRHVEPVEQGGFGLDGMWNDDFHHACRVAATGHAEFYYTDFNGSPQELLAAARWGFLYQGQYSSHAKQGRGTPAWHLPGWRFVNCLQNHDQVSNSAGGYRLPQLSSPGCYRALTTLWLLAPGTPMFFMGQEFAASAPFLFFADHEVDLAKLVREGRWEYLRRFPRIKGREGAQVQLADPSDRKTFHACKLDWSELDRNRGDIALHRDLLRLRRTDPVISRQDKERLHGAVIGNDSFLLRWLMPDGDDRLLIVNLARDLHWLHAAEPLVASPPGTRWTLMFSSEDEIYGGSGTAVLNTQDWNLPGHAAILLRSDREEPES